MLHGPTLQGPWYFPEHHSPLPSSAPASLASMQSFRHAMDVHTLSLFFLALFFFMAFIAAYHIHIYLLSELSH